MSNKQLASRLLKFLPTIIIVTGILLRLIVYINNRCLWTDEVNIALNLYERSFVGLTTELSYQQYAPPLFLWACKLFTIIFGFSEQALRLYPLLTGIGCLLLLADILKKITSSRAVWYPLFILATGIFFLRYSTELKQYMSDAFVSTALIWTVLRIDIFKQSQLSFILKWLAVGSIVIWSSMPSVFILAGVGLYYMLVCFNNKKHKGLLSILIVSITWLTQFLLYYYCVLKQQISSKYLVSYHERYFLFATPENQEEWLHNKDLLKDILSNCFGEHSLPLTFNLLLLIIGLLVLLIKRRSIGVLLITPIILMLFTAAINQYSLIPRLTLFIMPLLVLIVGVGLNQLLLTKQAFIRLPIIAICLASILYTKPLLVLTSPIEEEQITEVLDCVVKQGYHSNEVYVYTGAVNSFRFYTTIHPDRTKWADIKGANLLPLHTPFMSISSKVALLYTIPFDSYETKTRFENFATLKDSCVATGGKAYLFKQ